MKVMLTERMEGGSLASGGFQRVQTLEVTGGAPPQPLKNPIRL
jgi:hypothetical protein